MDASFCCLECRLLQAATTACCECGSPAIGSVENARELLKYRNMKVAEPSTPKNDAKAVVLSIGGIAAYLGIAMSSLVWLPALPIAAGIGVVGGGAYAWKRRRTQLVAVPSIDPVTAGGAVTRHGTARKLTDTVPSIVDGAAVLAEEVVVARIRGVLFRRVAAAPFLVELDTSTSEEPRRLVVDGTLRITVPAIEHAKLARDDPRASALGLPAGLKVTGKVETATIREGDRITVTGELTSENIPALAFHRDAGATDVMRGRASAVVLIGPLVEALVRQPTTGVANPAGAR